MSNGPLKNCAAGICCPPPMQEKALAVLVKESAEALGPDITFVPPAPGTEDRQRATKTYLRIARGLIAKGIIGVEPGVAARLRKEGSPTEEELDRMLEA